VRAGDVTMPSVRAALALLLGLAMLLPLHARQASREPTAEELRTQTIDLLKRAEAAPPASEPFVQAITAAAEQLDHVAARTSSPDDGKAVRRAAEQLRARARDTSKAPFSAAAILALLDRVKIEGLTLDFQGSYTQPTTKEPAYGGHASAMGPPPTEAPHAVVTSPVTFAEIPCISAKTYCGGRTKDHILESGGSGLALFDYDGDGLLDIYVVTAFELSDARQPIPHKNALFKNEGNWHFRDVSAGSGLDVAAWGNGVCVGDYDGDGRLDLYVTNFGPNFLFHNNGNGTFTETAATAGVTADTTQGEVNWSTGCTFFDADGDGDLDLYVARYVSTSWTELAKAQRTLIWRGGPKTMVGPKGLVGQSDLFFENVGHGRFVEATAAHGLIDASRSYGFGVLATDYNDDGWIDLFVANDTSPNFLYRNRGNGQFESVGLEAGAAVNGEGRAQAGMGVDAADYDGDGWLDLVITNFAQDVNTLFRNGGGTQFEDVTSAVGLAAPTFARMGWGTVFLDADLDGRPDLFFANGHIYPNVDEFPSLNETFRQKNQLLLNVGGRFVDVSDVRRPDRRRGPHARRRRIALARAAGRSRSDPRGAPMTASRRDFLHSLGTVGLLSGTGARALRAPLAGGVVQEGTSGPDIGSLYAFAQKQADQSPLELSFLHDKFSDLAHFPWVPGLPTRG